jgi:hypothetical protein
MQQVAEPWLILSLSGSSFLLGLDAFAMDAPVWILTLLGGVLADRRDRRKVIFFFQAIQMVCPILLVVLILTGTIQVWMIIGLSLIVGITDTLDACLPIHRAVNRRYQPDRNCNRSEFHPIQFIEGAGSGDCRRGDVSVRACMVLWGERAVLHSPAAHGLLDSSAAQG